MADIKQQVIIKATDGASPTLQRMAGRFRDLSRAAIAVNQAGQLLGQSFALVSRVVGGSTRAIKSAVLAANQQAAAEMDLANALAARGQASDDVIQKTNRFNTSLQQLGIAGDEQLLQLQKQLILLGVNADQLEEATKQTIGFAEVTGDLNSAVRLVGRSYVGDISSLTRYGIKVENATQAQAKFGEMFTLAAERSGTFENRTNTLVFNLGDLEEALGATVSKSTVMNSVTAELSRAVLRFTGFLGTENGSAAVEGFAKSIVAVAAGALTSVLALMKLQQTAVNTFEKLKFAVGLREDFPVPEDAGDFEKMLTDLRNRLEGVVSGSIQVAVNDTTPRGGNGKGGKGPTDEAIAAEQKRIERIAELRRQEAAANRAFEVQQTKEINDLKFQQDVSAFQEREAAKAKIAEEQAKAKKAAEEQEVQRQKDLAQRVTDTASSSISGVFEAIGKGESVLGAIGNMLAGIIVMIGKMLVQMGTAAVAAGLLGTVIPFLAPTTGGPAGIAAGVAAIATGGAMIAIGSAIKAQKGAMLPGYGGGDRIPVLAEAGELIVRKEIAPQAVAAGFGPGGNGGGGGTTINISAPMPLSTAPPNGVVTQRHLSDALLPALAAGASRKRVGRFAGRN